MRYGYGFRTGRRRGYRRPRALSPLREHLRDTLWFAPTAGLVCVVVLWGLASWADTEIVEELRRRQAYDDIEALVDFAEDAKTIITTIASAMMTFIGVVFSISLVAVQMASGQFSPRVVRIFVRNRITKLTFAVFLATFLLSLLVMGAYDGSADPRQVTSVPLIQSILTVAMVASSLLLFIAYVNSTLRLMRISYVIDHIVREAIRGLRLQERNPDQAVDFGSETGTVAHTGPAGVLRDVNIARLVRLARRRGIVLRLIPRIGDFVVPGTPMLAVHGGEVPPRGWLRYTVSVGVERTFHQDLGFGLRQLADIGLRALSAAVNDPTTAVQAVDRIVQLLAGAVRLPLGWLYHRDARGDVRLVQVVPGWVDLVDLGFTEIRGCVPGNPQVSRRMMAGLDDLLRLAPEDRQAVLLRHRALLIQTVERTAPVAADREFALLPDRQGIG